MSLQVSTSLRTTEGRWTLPFCSRLSRKENRSAVRPTCIASRSWGHRPCSCRAQPARASSHATASLEVKSTELGFARTFAEEYVIGDLLGAGSFGTVHACTHRKTGRSGAEWMKRWEFRTGAGIVHIFVRYAVKTISKRFNEDRLEAKFVRRVLHEVDIYQHLGGSLNVAYLYGAYEDDYCVDLVMELCEGGELWKGIKSSSYTESQAARIIREIVRTVAQCHAKGVVMRDVKPENFLFLNAAENSPLKAIDFGIAEYCAADQTLQDRAGTPIYVAPEVLKRNYGQKADLWSVGIVAYQLLTGRLPFLDDGGLMASSLTLTRKGFSNKDIFRAILYAELDFSSDPWGQRSSQALDFVKKLLCRDPARRPCAEEVLQHSWLAEDAGEGPMLDPMGSTLVQRLQRYGTYGKFKQTALRAIAHIVAVDGSLGTEALRREFERLDQDHDGHVTYRDVSGVLEREGYNLSQTETEQLLATLDLDCSGEVDSDNWLAALMDWEQLQHSPGWAALVEQAFVLFDADRSGRIGMHDLELLLCGAEGCRVPDTVNAVLREADIDHDGGISLDEFKLLMLPNEYDRLEFYESRVNPCRVKERLDGAADGVGTSSAAPS